MLDTYKFPGGYDVKVVRKQDIIDCININIVDKEVALALVQQCEIDANKFLASGRWTGIPFIGSIRANQVVQLERSEDQKELIEAAYETVSPDQYVMFRKTLNYDNHKRVKAQRYYNYVLSMAISRNRNLYKKMCKEKGEAYTRIHFFLNHSICAVNNEFEIVDDEVND